MSLRQQIIITIVRCTLKCPSFYSIVPAISLRCITIFGQRPGNSCDSVDWFSDNVPKLLATASIGFRTASRKFFRQRRLVFGRCHEDMFDSVAGFSYYVSLLAGFAFPRCLLCCKLCKAPFSFFCNFCISKLDRSCFSSFATCAQLGHKLRRLIYQGS